MSKILIIVGIIMMSVGFSRIAHAGDMVICESLDYKCQNDQLVDNIENLELLNSFASENADRQLVILEATVLTQASKNALANMRHELNNVHNLVLQSRIQTSKDLKVLQHATILKDFRINRVLIKQRDALRESESIYLKASADLRRFKSQIEY